MSLSSEARVWNRKLSFIPEGGTVTEYATLHIL